MTLVKYGAGRPKKGDFVKQIKRFIMDDLQLDRRNFRRMLLPTYFDYVMCLDDPFNTHEETIISALRRMRDIIFPQDTQEIAADGPLKVLVWIFFY